MNNEEMYKIMDVMVRMKLMESIDTSIKKIMALYKDINFKTIKLDKFKSIAKAFEAVSDAMEEQNNGEEL